MSDIIKDAKQLLDGSTPGPWKWEERTYKDDFECRHDWLGSVHSTALITIDSDEYSSWVEASDADKSLTAAAPELAQALAEETWEYSFRVQNTIGMWEHPTVRADDPERWWETKEEAEEVAIEVHACGYPIRIVCRRVSPVEVINE